MFLILSSSYVLTFCIDVIFVLSMINMLRLMPQNVLVHKMSYIGEGQNSHLDIKRAKGQFLNTRLFKLKGFIL